jgi:preprotein translocase subunit SecG
MINVIHKFLIYLSIYFCLTCFGLSVSSSSEADVQFRQWFKFAGFGVSPRLALTQTPHPADLNHSRSCTPASEDGLLVKESPKHVRQK